MVKCVIKQLEKPQEVLEDLLYTYFKCGDIKMFFIAKQAGLLMREHLYSTIVVIVTINGQMDDTDHVANA